MYGIVHDPTINHTDRATIRAALTDGTLVAYHGTTYATVNADAVKAWVFGDNLFDRMLGLVWEQSRDMEKIWDRYQAAKARGNRKNMLKNQEHLVDVIHGYLTRCFTPENRAGVVGVRDAAAAAVAAGVRPAENERLTRDAEKVLELPAWGRPLTDEPWYQQRVDK